jgi:hypothetical protein
MVKTLDPKSIPKTNNPNKLLIFIYKIFIFSCDMI